MDTNYLLKREQMSMMMAHRAVSVEARRVHVALAQGYARLLADRRFPHRRNMHADRLSDNENPDRGLANPVQAAVRPMPPLAIDRNFPSNPV